MTAVRDMPHARRRAAMAALVFAIASAACAAPAPPAAAPAELATLPVGERWQQHLATDLLPFWTLQAALGEPLGNFPFTRCNDGSALDRARPCPEVGKNGWLMMDRNYVVSMSRQTYGYGVAFHMTGDRRYLEYAKAGVDYLRNARRGNARGHHQRKGVHLLALLQPRTERAAVDAQFERRGRRA